MITTDTDIWKTLSSATKDMKINTPMRSQLTLVRMAIIKNKNMPGVGVVVAAVHTFI